jgi:hypothetical protein
LLSLALFAATLTFLLYAQTAPALYTRHGWVPVALLLALRASQVGPSPAWSLPTLRVFSWRSNSRREVVHNRALKGGPA